MLRQSPRIFKLTRIRNLIPTDGHFLERDIHIEEEEVDTGSSTIIDFKLKIEPIAAYRVFDDFGDGILQGDGSYIVNISWDESDWLYELILSYGENIEILEPPHAREVLCKKIEKINKKYS